MSIQIGYPDLLTDLPLPDVTHDTAAVAMVVDIQDQNGHGGQARVEPSFRRRCRRFFMQQRHGAPSFPRCAGRSRGWFQRLRVTP